MNKQDAKESVKSRLFTILPPAFLIAANLFLFVPFVIYIGNPDEFGAPFVYILRFFSLPAAVLMVVLAVIGVILPSKPRKRYVSLLFVIGLLVWIQSSFLVWNYGVFAGQGIDWSIDSWRGWTDGTVWVVMLSAGFFFFRYISRITSFASMALIGLQAAYLIVLSTQNPVIWTKSMPEVVPQDELFEFSSKQNVVHVILDMFQSDIFEEIVEERPEYYRNKLDGFVFFREATSSFPTTVVSIPSIMTGEVYKNDEGIRGFQKRMQTGKSFPDAMQGEGYQLDLVGEFPSLYSTEKPTNFYEVPVPYGVNQTGYSHATSTLMMDMTLFRAVPHLFKRYVYNDQLWLMQRLFPVETALSKQKKQEKENPLEQRLSPVENDMAKQKKPDDRSPEVIKLTSFKEFLSDFVKTSSVKRQRPVYKLIHLMTSHIPWVTNKDCGQAGEVLKWTRENVKNQQRCALDGFIALLDKLRDIGVYDSALVIVNSDHGAMAPVKLRRGEEDKLIGITASQVGQAAALLAVKPPGAKGPLKTSDAQVMLTDIPATVGAMLGLKQKFNGRSVFDVKAQETRDRRFYYYGWSDLGWEKDSFEHLDEFIIKGSILNADSWRTGTTLFPSGASYDSKKIDLGSDEGRRFLRPGWGGNDKFPDDDRTLVWSIGRANAVYLALPKDTFTLLTADLLSYPFDGLQYVTVRVDGKVVDGWELQMPPVWAAKRTLVPPDAQRPKVSVIEFEFARVRAQTKSIVDDRPIAVAFDKITTEEVVPFYWGGKFTLGKDGNANQFAVDGWSAPEKDFMWAMGKGASLAIPMKAAPGGGVLKVVLHPLVVAGKVSSQRVEMVVNGKTLGKWTLSKSAYEEYVVSIPGSLIATPNVLKVEFKTLDAVSPKSLGLSDDVRVLGVAIRSVELIETIEDIKPFQWDSRFTLGKGGNANQFAIDGWSAQEKDFLWTLGQGASFTVPMQAAPRGGVLKAVLHPFTAPGKVSSQRVEVVVNGKTVGNWALFKPSFWTFSNPSYEERIVSIPGSLLTTANVMKVEFKTPDAVSPKSLGLSGDGRVLGVAVRSIEMTETK